MSSTSAPASIAVATPVVMPLSKQGSLRPLGISSERIRNGVSTSGSMPSRNGNCSVAEAPSRRTTWTLAV